MGCCGSSEAVAPETELPKPEWGKPYRVRMKKAGMFSADYNVLMGHEEDAEKWMLLDAVGSMWDEGYSYYLKHRSPGEVDDEGKPKSTVLGATDIKGDYDCFSFKICGADRDKDIGLMFDNWDGDFDIGMTTEEQLWAVWTYSKRAILYSDYEMRNQIGFLDITGSGTWFEKEEERIIYDTDEDGKQTMRKERYRYTDCKTQGFKYKFEVFNTPMHITYKKLGGSFWKASKLSFTAANAFDLNTPMFKVDSDGENNCTIETFENCDPVTAMLASYAISCKLDPKEFGSKAERKCEQHMHLGMRQGHSHLIGMDEQEFATRFSKYPAPVPQVFVQAMAVYVPPPPVMMTFTQTSTTTTNTVVGADGTMQQQQQTTTTVQQQQQMVQQQPMMVQQPMMMAAQPGQQQMMMQPGMQQQPMMMQPGMQQQQQPMMMAAQPGQQQMMMQPGMQQQQPMMMAQPGQQQMMMQPGMQQQQPVAYQ